MEKVRTKDNHKMEVRYKTIDELQTKGLEENYKRTGLEFHKQGMDTCIKTLKESNGNKTDYELLQRTSRAIASDMETAFILQVDTWKDIVNEWGMEGIFTEEKAQKMEPGRIEFDVWLVQNIGTYSQAITGSGTGIMETKYYKKVKQVIEKAYELDKTYLDGLPLLVKAIFCMKHPFIGKKKAWSFYQEFESNTTWNLEPYRRYPHAAALLLNMSKEMLKSME